jgi:hypothetical protein
MVNPKAFLRNSRHARQKSGRPVDMRDTRIAGIALARHVVE